MLNRPGRLRFFDEARHDHKALHNNYFRRRPIQIFSLVFLLYMAPYYALRTMKKLDELPVWEARIEKKRVRKMAFDFMVKNQAEKERDLIEEYADF